MLGKEYENHWLECKSKDSPENGGMSQGDKGHFAKVLSGFSNTSGGVLIFGLKASRDKSDDMDIYSVSMLWSDPDEMIQGILTGSHLHGRMRFGFPVFKNFINANNIQLVVRGHQKWNEGYHIFFNGQLYSLFSTQTYDGKIKFDPKILRLDYGKPPRIIPINFEPLESELD